MAKTGRLEIRAENQFLENLDQLARENGLSKAAIIQRAVILYAQALKEVEAGKSIEFVPTAQTSTLSNR